jgi:hypothetical protein
MILLRSSAVTTVTTLGLLCFLAGNSNADSQFTSSTAYPSNYWRIKFNPTSSLKQIAPTIDFGGIHYITESRGIAAIILDGTVFQGSWKIRPNPYELLEKIPDSLLGTFGLYRKEGKWCSCVRGEKPEMKVFLTGLSWRRHLPSVIPTRITHGMVTVQISPQSRRIVVGTFDCVEKRVILPQPKLMIKKLAFFGMF